jgi:hypothetical protein
MQSNNPQATRQWSKLAFIDSHTKFGNAVAGTPPSVTDKRSTKAVEIQSTDERMDDYLDECRI